MSSRPARTIAAAVVVALAFVLTACGDDGATPAVTGADVGVEPAEGEAPADESEGADDTNQEGGFGDDTGEE